MGLETIATVGGLAGNVIGGLVGGHSQNKANQQAINAQNAQNQYINQIGSSMINANQSPNVYSQMLQQQLANGSLGRQDILSNAPQYQAQTANTSLLTNPASSYTAQGYSPAMGTAQGYGANTTNLGDFAKQFFGQVDENGMPVVAKAQAGTSGVDKFVAQQIANAALAGNVGNVGAQQIDLGKLTGIGGQNAGNDALMQMLRSDPRTQTTATDAQMQQMLETGNPFNTSDIFNQMQTVNNDNYRKALGDIQGSFGSLGSRFGSAGAQKIAQGTQDLTNQFNLQNAQVGAAAYSDAQNRKLQAAAQLNQQENARRGDYLQAALGAGNLGNAQANLLLQGSQANQSADLQSQLANQSVGQQTNLANQEALNQIALANQGAYNNAGMQTQQLGAQVGMANAQNQTQASLANAQAQNAARMAQLQLLGAFQGQNVDALNSAAAFGANAGNAMSQFNAGAQNTAGQFLAGAQNDAGQFGANANNAFAAANQAALNNNAQFNAAQQNAAGQFNANQVLNTTQLNNQSYNQQTAAILQALGLGNQMQLGQQQLNAGILGTMAGLQTPQPNQAAGYVGNAIGDAGMLGMMLPLLMGGRTTGTQGMMLPQGGFNGGQYNPVNPASTPLYIDPNTINSPFNSPFGSVSPFGMGGGYNPVLRLP